MLIRYEIKYLRVFYYDFVTFEREKIFVDCIDGRNFTKLVSSNYFIYSSGNYS